MYVHLMEREDDEDDEDDETRYCGNECGKVLNNIEGVYRMVAPNAPNSSAIDVCNDCKHELKRKHWIIIAGEK